MPPNNPLVHLAHMRAKYGDEYVQNLLANNQRFARQIVQQQRPQQMMGSLPRTFDPFEQAQVIENNQLGDEFTNLMGSINRAFALPDGSFTDEMSAMVALRQEKQAQEDDEAPRVSINPPSARKGLLGGAGLMANGAPAQRVVNWSADRMDEAIPLSIFVGPVGSDQFGVFTANGAQNRPYANVYWLGGRGTPMSAQVDIGKGKHFNLHGSFCAVDIGLDAGNAAGSMSLGAWLSFYPVSRQTPMTRTLYMSIAAAGTSTQIIPSCATGLLPLQVDLATFTSNGILMTFRDRNGTTTHVSTLQLNGQQVSPIPIGDDDYDIVFTNNEAGTVAIRAIFELSF